MATITGLQSSLVRDANTALATAFFPRFLKSFWPQLCGSTLSTALVEPFALDGASPLLKRFYGTMQGQLASSWTLSVPNLLFKNIEEINREDFEMDQTGTVIKRTAAIGVRLATFPDYLFAKRLLTADQTSSASIVFRNQTYYTTFESNASSQIPFFASNHNSYGGATQSNIITGNLPTTIASVASNDVGQMAQAMIKDLELVIDTFASFKDDKGAPLYPDLDTEKDVVVVVPPGLRPVAKLALTTPGVLGGSPGSQGSTGSTTNLGPMLVKKVLSPGLLRGCPDIESEIPNATVSPLNATQYYVFIENDYVRPFYFQRFRPKKGGEFMPVGSDPEADAERALEAAGKAGFKITPEAADVYAAAEVDSNLAALGDKAQESVVKNEKFFISGRARGNFVYGPWFTGIKVDPTGTSN